MLFVGLWRAVRLRIAGERGVRALQLDFDLAAERFESKLLCGGAAKAAHAGRAEAAEAVEAKGAAEDEEAAKGQGAAAAEAARAARADAESAGQGDTRSTAAIALRAETSGAGDWESAFDASLSGGTSSLLSCAEGGALPAAGDSHRTIGHSLCGVGTAFPDTGVVDAQRLDAAPLHARRRTGEPCAVEPNGRSCAGDAGKAVARGEASAGSGDCCARSSAPNRGGVGRFAEGHAFAHCWNKLVQEMRLEDLISDEERAALEFAFLPISLPLSSAASSRPSRDGEASTRVRLLPPALGSFSRGVAALLSGAEAHALPRLQRMAVAETASHGAGVLGGLVGQRHAAALSLALRVVGGKLPTLLQRGARGGGDDGHTCSSGGGCGDGSIGSGRMADRSADADLDSAHVSAIPSALRREPQLLHSAQSALQDLLSQLLSLLHAAHDADSDEGEAQIGGVSCDGGGVSCDGGGGGHCCH
eukprot:2915622-Pleurochrysis_carterae.AAC.1